MYLLLLKKIGYNLLMNLWTHIKKLNRFELTLWLSSLTIIILSFLISPSDYMILAATLVGVTALIFIAKGLPIGQVLTILFSILYGIVSYQFRYYGEMITYLGMTLPSALYTLIIWLKHPYDQGSGEVKISRLSNKSITITLVSSIVVTFIFYFILEALYTPNLIISTVSVLTSMLASLLMMYRVPYYAIAYALNDIVLIILWVLASLTNIAYIPMIICFVIFFVNDLYAFIDWTRRRKIQSI